MPFMFQCRLAKIDQVFPHKESEQVESVFLSAYTGMAANGFDGSTLHSLRGLSFGTSPQSVREISSSTLNTYCCALSEIRVLVIGEISFVGSNLLHCVDERLRTICQLDLPFGGIALLCFSDLSQLEPVRDGNVFEDSSKQYS